LAQVSSPEPTVRGTVLVGMTAATRQLWGRDALDLLKGRLELPPERALFDEIATPLAWYPEQLAVRLARIVWDDLAARDEAAFTGFAERTIDHGWGRVHSVLVRLATPRILARRAPELWRRDHSHGAVEVAVLDATSLRLRLSDHPYVHDPVMRRFQAESFRYILSLTRVPELTVVEGTDPRGSLVMTAAWR
jgi:uncharacterized protein (TIGR02265 family)